MSREGHAQLLMAAESRWLRTNTVTAGSDAGTRAKDGRKESHRGAAEKRATGAALAEQPAPAPQPTRNTPHGDSRQGARCRGRASHATAQDRRPPRNTRPTCQRPHRRNSAPPHRRPHRTSARAHRKESISPRRGFANSLTDRELEGQMGECESKRTRARSTRAQARDKAGRRGRGCHRPTRRPRRSRPPHPRGPPRPAKTVGRCVSRETQRPLQREPLGASCSSLQHRQPKSSGIGLPTPAPGNR